MKRPNPTIQDNDRIIILVCGDQEPIDTNLLSGMDTHHIREQSMKARVLHTLAAGPARGLPQLMARLEQDGLEETQRSEVAGILRTMARVDEATGDYRLKSSRRSSVNQFWPFYRAEERKFLGKTVSACTSEEPKVNSNGFTPPSAKIPDILQHPGEDSFSFRGGSFDTPDSV
jgi:hypothetical protein